MGRVCMCFASFRHPKDYKFTMPFYPKKVVSLLGKVQKIVKFNATTTAILS